MAEETNKNDSLLDFHYKEYTRIANRIDSMVDGSFTDFKMLGVIGATLASHPIVDAIDVGASMHDKEGTSVTTADLVLHSAVLLMTFTAILIFASILAIRYMTKYNIINKLMKELIHFEEAIRRIMSKTGDRTFCVATNWLGTEEKVEGHHHKIVREFYLLFGFVLLVYPIAVLTMEGREDGIMFPAMAFNLIYLFFYFVCICMVVKARIEVYMGLDVPEESWGAMAQKVFALLVWARLAKRKGKSSENKVVDQELSFI